MRFFLLATIVYFVVDHQRGNLLKISDAEPEDEFFTPTWP